MAVQISQATMDAVTGIHASWEQQVQQLRDQRDALDTQIAAAEQLAIDAAAIVADLEVAPSQ